MKKLLFIAIIAIIIAGCGEGAEQTGCFVATQGSEEIFIRCVTKSQFESLKNSRSYEGLTNKRFEECSNCQE